MVQQYTSGKESNPPLAAEAVIENETTRYIPKAIRNHVWKRDEGKCRFRHPQTKQLCLSTFAIQIDHIIPFGLGGSSSDPYNLRLVCQAHNQWLAMKTFGKSKINAHQNSAKSS